MTEGRLHAFTDDALADHDAVAIAALIRDGELSAREVAEAAIARAERVNPTLNAVVHEAYQQARSSAATPSYGALAGVPTFVKDNTPVAGMPTGHGTAAFRARPASKDGPFACQFLSAGFTVLGKSSLPEFGFNASTEFADGDPTRNPWHTGYSAGASSGDRRHWWPPASYHPEARAPQPQRAVRRAVGSATQVRRVHAVEQRRGQPSDLVAAGRHRDGIADRRAVLGSCR